MAISPCGGSTYSISIEGRELVSHGTPLFPIAFYNDDLERDRVPWHWHDELEAVRVSKGETVVFTGSRRYHLREGQGFVINSGVLHAAQGVAGTGCEYHSMVFHPRLIGGGIDSVFWQVYLRPLIGSGRKDLVLDLSQPWHEEALRHIETAWQSGAQEVPGYEFKVRAELSELTFLLCSHLPAKGAQASEKAHRDGERIKQMLRFVQTNYAEEITVADIAKAAMISESECLRCFRGTIGVPPIQYVKRYRIQKAAELLSATDLKISEIGEQCGFQDISYFTRSFREIKGMTPGEYRQTSR